MNYAKQHHVAYGIPQSYNIFVLQINVKFYVLDGSCI